MTKTKLMKRQEHYQPRQQFQANHRPIGNKNIFNRSIRKRQIKIKKVFRQFLGRQRQTYG